MEKIISGTLEKQVKKHGTLNCKKPTGVPAKYEPVVLISLSNGVKQKFRASLPEVSEPTKHWQEPADTPSFSNPTPVILEIMSKLRQMVSTSAAHRGEIRRSTTPTQPRGGACNDGWRPEFTEPR
jgi:hypothetical protein